MREPDWIEICLASFALFLIIIMAGVLLPCVINMLRTKGMGDTGSAISLVLTLGMQGVALLVGIELCRIGLLP